MTQVGPVYNRKLLETGRRVSLSWRDWKMLSCWLEDGGGTRSKGIQKESRKVEETGCPLEPPEDWYCHHLDFSPMRPTVDS